MSGGPPVGDRRLICFAAPPAGDNYVAGVAVLTLTKWWEAADGSVASGGVRETGPRWESSDFYRERDDFYLRRRDRHAGRNPLHHTRGRTRRPARSRAAVRRSLHGRRDRGRARLDRGFSRPRGPQPQPQTAQRAGPRPALAAVVRPPAVPGQQLVAFPPQRGPSLQHRLSHLSTVSGFRPAIFVRLFRKQERVARRGAARQK